MQAKAEAKAVETGVAAAPADVHQSTRDSVRAIMLIRAYRMRGHLHAKLDPLAIAAPVDDYHELSPSNYGFGPEDMDRPIFIDNVLGLEYATLREIVDILERTYCSTLGVEFMHISDPEIKGWIQERIEGAGQGRCFHAGRQEGDSATSSIEAEGFENFIDVKYTGTKRFGLDGGESLIPALEQIIKRGGQLGLRGSRARHGPPWPTQCSWRKVMGKPHRA